MSVNKSKKYSGKIFLFFGLLMLSFIVLITMPRLSFPLIFAYILSLVIKPVLPLLSGLGLKKNISIYIIFVILIVLLVLPFVKLVPIIKEESENLQFYLPKLETFVRAKFTELQTYSSEKIGIEINNNIFEDAVYNLEDGFKSAIFKVPNYVASILEWIFLVPIFLFFLMKEGHALRKGILQLVPNSFFERGYNLYSQFHKKLGDYILAKFIEATIVGLLIGTGLAVMGVRFAVLLGLLAAITNIIPYVGPVLGTVPALILAMVEYGTVGSQYFGIFGMVASIPMAAVVKLLFEQVQRELYPVQSKRG